MKLNNKQIETVLALPGQERYEHFIKVVVDWEEAWGLYCDGWALASTESGESVFPFWPAAEYAKLCAAEDWEDYEPASIPLQDLIEKLLPRLKDDGVLPGIFYTPSQMGVTPSVDQMLSDLDRELDRY